MFNILDLEAKALAALQAAEAFFESDPAAKQLAEDAKTAFVAAKTDTVNAAADGLEEVVADFLGKTMTPDQAQAAGFLAKQAVVANADAILAPGRGSVGYNLSTAAQPEEAPQ